jgi:hypothetical protein
MVGEPSVDETIEILHGCAIATSSTTSSKLLTKRLKPLPKLSTAISPTASARQGHRLIDEAGSGCA